MTVEELIAKLGFKVSGLSEATKFVRKLEELRKATDKAGKGLKLNFTGSASGLGRIVRDLERASSAAKKFEQAASRAARVRFNNRGPQFPGHPGHPGVPGRPGVSPRGEDRGSSGGGLGGLVDVAVGAAAAVTGVKALKTFGNLEQAMTELGITAEKTTEQMAPALAMFRAEAPKLGTTAKDMAEIANAFVAAGIDYDTSVKAAVLTNKAAKASYTDMNDSAQAGISTVQNLGIKIEDLGKAYDIMIGGGKLGKAEFNEMAGVMPQLASSGSKIGLKGTKGLRDIVAALEVVREGSATTGDAAIHLKDFMEKMSDPVTAKYLKKHAKINWEKEMKDADKKGQSRLDRALDIVGKYTKGDSFRLGELFHEQQSRDAINQLITKRPKFEEFRKNIDEEAGGSTDRDLARVLGTFNNSVDRFSAAVDRLMGVAGEKGADAAKGVLAVGEAAATGASGEGSTSAETNKTVEKMNRLLGLPPTYHNVLGRYGMGVTKSDFDARYNDSMGDKPGGIKPGSVWNRQSWKNATPGAIGRGGFGLNGPIGGTSGQANAESMKQAVQQTTNTTNNTNVGNDQRTQTASVTVNATGLEAVGQAVLAKVQAGLSSLGPSVVKGNLTATGATTSP